MKNAQRAMLAGMAMILVAAAVPAVGRATSYDPLTSGGEQAPVVMVKGAAVHLFSSGNDLVAKSVRVGDRLIVLRRDGAGEAAAVGSVRVSGFVGKTCLEGEVLEGNVRIHDLAAKDGIYFLVIPAALCTE